MSTGLMAYIDKLQHENADDLAFYPLETLRKAYEAGQVILAVENDEPAGYLWHGPIRGGSDARIYQACVDYSARRRHLGFAAVARLMDLSRAKSATAVRLRCASSSDSNEFWQAIGFECIAVQPGGIKRARDINVWRAELQPGMFALPSTDPSTRAIDLRAYTRLVKAGTAMPSRFSRVHYGSES